MWELIADLRDMGESNAILGRRAAVGRDVLTAASSIYQGNSKLRHIIGQQQWLMKEQRCTAMRMAAYLQLSP